MVVALFVLGIAIFKIIEKWDELVSELGAVVRAFDRFFDIRNRLRATAELIVGDLGRAADAFRPIIDAGDAVLDFFGNVFTGRWSEVWFDIQTIGINGINFLIRGFNSLAQTAINTINIPSPHNLFGLLPDVPFDPFDELDLPVRPARLQNLFLGRIAGQTAERLGIGAIFRLLRGDADDVAAAVRKVKEEFPPLADEGGASLRTLREEVILTAQEIANSLGGAAQTFGDAFGISTEVINALLVDAAAGAGFVRETWITAFNEMVSALGLSVEQAKRLMEKFQQAFHDASTRSASQIVDSLGGAAREIADEFDLSLRDIEQGLRELAIEAGFAGRDIEGAFQAIADAVGRSVDEIRDFILGLRDAANETLSFFDRVMEAVQNILNTEEQALVDLVAAGVRAGESFFAALFAAMRQLRDAQLIEEIEGLIDRLFGGRIEIADFVGHTLTEIRDILLGIEADPNFASRGTAQTFAVASAAPDEALTSGVPTVNLGGITIFVDGTQEDSEALTTEIERQMRSRRLRGF